MNLVKYSEADTNTEPKASIQTLEQFNMMLNEDPDPKEVQVNAMAGNSKYLPISYIQTLLDEFFVGIWRTRDFKYQVVVNELVGSVVLEYFHPFAKMWIERQGAASVMIMQKSGSDITDIGAKIKNTLAKDHPHLLASCITNAARTIGRRFGRDLNRKHEDTYTTLYTDIAASEDAVGSIDWNLVKTRADLARIWKEYPGLHNNKNFIKKFTYESNRLSK